MKISKEDLRFTQDDIQEMYSRYHFPKEISDTIERENLLPHGLLNRLEAAYPQHSGLREHRPFMFNDKVRYSGIKGFREIVAILESHGIDIGHLSERELFIDVYRFMATRHALNSINWDHFAKDSVFQLVFPQPGMINKETVKQYSEATSDQERRSIVLEYQKLTNPHDGKQKLNKPWFVNEEGELEILQGSQHKYPVCQLIFDKTTQNCFAFCSYCFRHAQVRGDEDMFSQDDIDQIHKYLRQHQEVSDILITGGDAGFIPFDRLKAYMAPIVKDTDLLHIKTLRLGSRALTFQPEIILSDSYTKTLELFKELTENGIQVAWMGHFSTPREIINPATIAAIRRLKHYGVTVKSQSPIMHHISLFSDENGIIDVDRSAQNWIDLGHILAMMGVGFHSMYCARPTGEHHYFTAPLAEINKVFSKVYRTLPSISRPSRYITMTSSAGKISLLGTVEVNGETAFALKFNEGRNMEWLDKVYLAKYDPEENTIEKLKPFDTEKYFYEDELQEIENSLTAALEREIKREQ
jgi:lysine 2,3-aminomutase